VRPRFRQGEVVRLPAGAPRSGEAIVDDVAGPDDDGVGWIVHVWVDEPDGPRSLWTFPEAALTPTGAVEDARGRRLDGRQLPPAEERFDTLRLRLVTELTDSVVAARMAERLDAELRGLVGPCVIAVEAERHWAEPYHYELEVVARPLGDAVAALRALADSGGEGWLACTDDGWRCDLWWSADEDDDAVLLLSEVRGAEVSFLPWSSPARRPANEQPLISV
jgi:hypothetical protein